MSVLRVLGDISVLLFISHRLNYLGDVNLYFISLVVCVILYIMFNIIKIFIAYHRFKYMVKVFKSDVLDVIN